MATHDTAKVRSAARKIGQCANSVAALPRGNLRSVTTRLPLEFKGEAADALFDRLVDMIADLTVISDGLQGISDDLFRYARRLDEADEAARRTINGGGGKGSFGGGGGGGGIR